MVLRLQLERLDFGKKKINFISFAIDCVERRPTDKNNVTQLLAIAITSILFSFAEFFLVQIGIRW